MPVEKIKRLTIKPTSQQAARILEIASNTLQIEADAIRELKKGLGQEMVLAVQALKSTTGRVVVVGIGKSGHIARKIAATLASTGTAAMFVHAAEASHGDLGMITDDDLVLALSNSGETDELNVILPTISRLGIPIVAITGRKDSSLSKLASVVLLSGVEQEACPLNLAPTASTAAQLAIGDALAMALLDAKGFQAEDFARSHPGGDLGRRLLTRVRDVMRSGNAVPQVGARAGFSEVMREMSAKGLGVTAIINENNRVIGIFTDGDLRRLLEQGVDFHAAQALDFMHADPVTIQQEQLALEAAELMETHRITSLLVVDSKHQLCGALNSHDLMRAKVI
jgi:arabinose-5-phosphate isomerase